MRFLFLADGPRDRGAVPEFVKTILNSPIDVEFKEWKAVRLNRGSGYTSKLQFEMLRARDRELDGVVATIDSDREKPRDRLSKLRTARDKNRQNPQATPLPTAIGEAVPHLEAWLLDDPKAVRDVLRFASDKVIPNVLQIIPKECLEALVGESERAESPLDLLPEIARNVVVSRCNHSSDTGFLEFVREVLDELGPLVSTAA